MNVILLLGLFGSALVVLSFIGMAKVADQRIERMHRSRACFWCGEPYAEVNTSAGMFERMLVTGLCPRCQRLELRQYKWHERAQDTRKSRRYRERAERRRRAIGRRIEALMLDSRRAGVAGPHAHKEVIGF